MNTNKAQRFKNCKIPGPPQGKKRSIDDLVTDCDTETDIGKCQAGEAKERSLRFTPEELELPQLYATDDTGGTGGTGEDRDSAKELIKAAAESIATCWKKIHQMAGLLKVDGTQTNGLAPSSNSGTEPPAKRACQSHDSHGLRGGSHNSRSAADPATNDDPMSNVDQDLRGSLTERDPDYDRNSSREVGDTPVDQDAPGLDEQGRNTYLCSPTSFQPSIQQQQGTQYRVASSQGLQSSSNAISRDTTCSPQALKTSRQAEMEVYVEASNNHTSAGASMGHANFQPQATEFGQDTSTGLQRHEVTRSPSVRPSEVIAVGNVADKSGPSGINQDLSLEVENSQCSLATSENRNTAAATPSTGYRQPFTRDANSGTDQGLTPIVAQDWEGLPLGLSRSELQEQDQDVVAGAERGGNIAGTQFGQDLEYMNSFILDDPALDNLFASTEDIFNSQGVHELMIE
ncbi:hypothetical protein IL306_011102 [Fusarium sp. DS 682]|nr:hypothetical protein IL306_011102 [Fusarium sp. DS 682]